MNQVCHLDCVCSSNNYNHPHHRCPLAYALVSSQNQGGWALNQGFATVPPPRVCKSGSRHLQGGCSLLLFCPSRLTLVFPGAGIHSWLGGLLCSAKRGRPVWRNKDGTGGHGG